MIYFFRLVTSLFTFSLLFRVWSCPRESVEMRAARMAQAERQMRAAVRSQGRLVKKGGAMASSGLAEFQVASGAALERLVNKA